MVDHSPMEKYIVKLSRQDLDLSHVSEEDLEKYHEDLGDIDAFYKVKKLSIKLSRKKYRFRNHSVIFLMVFCLMKFI